MEKKVLSMQVIGAVCFVH